MRTFLQRFLYLNAILVIAFGLIFRFLDLDHIPGITGDDSWLAIQIKQMFAGEDFTFITPTHRLVSPLHILLCIPFYILPTTSLWLLKMPTLISGLAVVPLVYFLFRKTLAKDTLAVLLILVSTLPISILYSRSLGEMSQLVLAMPVVLYFLMNKRIWLGLLAMAISLTIHPSCIFLMPLVLCLIVFQVWNDKFFNKKALVLPLVVFIGVLGWQIWIYPYAWEPIFRSVQLSLTDFDTFANFLQGFVRVYSGANALENFAGPIPSGSLLWMDVLASVFLGFSLVGGGILIWRREKKWNLTLVILLGVFLSAVLQYLVSGIHTVKVGYERFALYLAVPMAVLLSLIFDGVFKEKKWRTVGLSFAVFIGWAQLLNVQIHFFDLIKKTGGQSVVIYRSAEIDPKLTAYEWMANQQKMSPGPSKKVVTEDWSLFWPTSYLDSQAKIFEVLTLDYLAFDKSFKKLLIGREAIGAALNEGAIFMGFPGGPVEQMFSLFPKEQIVRKDFLDYSGRVALTVWQVTK